MRLNRMLLFRTASALILGAAMCCAELPPLPAGMEFAPLPRKAADPPLNPSTPAKIILGQRLFFDPILSAPVSVACSTCHQPALAWTDGKVTARGIGTMMRNTPTILNTAFNANDSMFWDNRELTLEAQVLHPVRARNEMRGDMSSEKEIDALIVQRVRDAPGYASQFKAVFKGTVTMPRIAQAIAAFERSLITPDTAFDRYLRGERAALTPAQLRGMKAFTRAGCQQCHGGPMLSDFKLHVLGAPGERQAFRTPSLRNVHLTAPYMHNGSLRTINDVLAFYEQLMDEVSETIDGGDSAMQPSLDPLLKHLSLHPADFADINAFLGSLGADDYPRPRGDQ